MRYLVIVKATPESEAGAVPGQELFEEMGKFNEELVKAGVLLDAAGLLPSSQGARVRFTGDKKTIIDGPFSETKELIAGYWVWQVSSKEEALAWAMRIPNPYRADGEVEIRKIAEAADFGEAMTPELKDQEERIGAQMAQNAQR